MNADTTGAAPNESVEVATSGVAADPRPSWARIRADLGLALSMYAAVAATLALLIAVPRPAKEPLAWAVLAVAIFGPTLLRRLRAQFTVPHR